MNPNNEQIIMEWAQKYKESGISIPEMILTYYPNQSNVLTDADLWEDIEDKETSNYISVDIINTEINDWQNNCLETFAKSVATSIQFPVNSCFLHGMGCLSSAMSRQFVYNFKGDHDHPVNLFCVGSQPPSTGKSGVNSSFLNPVRIAYQDVNKKNSGIRKEEERKIKSAANQLKQASNPNEIEALERDMSLSYAKIEAHPSYVLSVDDATPEGLEKMMGNQLGWGNLISDESDVINTMLGFTYGDKAKKTNNGIFLKMFDGEWHSSVRSGREGYSGQVKGTFSVLAQPESIDHILLAGQSGRGVSERFLLIKENHLLGTRDHTKYIPIDSSAKANYINTVNRLVFEEKTTLTFSEPAINMIDLFRNGIESEMGDGGKYSDNMMRGAMGKADKQICKISCILWASQEWSKSGRRRKQIGVKTVKRAIEMFKELSKTYLQAAEENGYAGISPKVNIIKEYLIKKYKKDIKLKQVPHITASSLQQNLKRLNDFKTIPRLANYLKTMILPVLISDKTLIFANGKYYINPKIGEIDN